jgi:hypothetical protein
MPYDDAVDFAAILHALAESDFIRQYTAEGREYAYIPSFARWQTFHRNESPSADPDPPGSVTQGVDPLNGRIARPWISRVLRVEIMERDGGRCVDCNTTDQLTIDHIVPYAKGGTNEPSNLRVLCRVCNSRKGATLLQPLATACNSGGSLLQQGATDATTPVAGTVAVTVTGTGTIASTTVAQPSGSQSNGVHRTGIQKLTPAEHRQLDEKFGGERQPAPVTVPRSVYAEQEAELRAAALPHEAMALDALLRTHRQPDALILELYSFASGMKVCRGETTGRNADVTDVMRAVAEMAANGAEWSVRLFRGYLRRVADQKPEPATLEDRTAARLAAEIRRHTPAEPTRGERNDAGAIVAVPIVTEAAETEDQIAARRKASAEAIAQFRQQFRQYNPTPSTDAIEPPADFPNDEAA